MDRSVSRDSASAKPSWTATHGRQTFENIRFQMIADTGVGVEYELGGELDSANRGGPEELDLVGIHKAGPKVAAILSIFETCRRIKRPEANICPPYYRAWPISNHGAYPA